MIRFLWRLLTDRRWAVVLVFPALPDQGLGEIRSPLESRLASDAAHDRRLALEQDPLVKSAIDNEGARLEVRRLDRFGFVLADG